MVECRGKLAYDQTVTTVATILFWVSVALLLDAAVGLWWLDHWQRVLPKVNIRLIALVEACVAGVLLLVQLGLRAATR